MIFITSLSSSLLRLYPAAGLRTPLAVPGPYPGAFGMLPHPAGMNGELAGAAGAAAYAAGLQHMSPQMSAAAAAAAVAAYGRSPMVSPRHPFTETTQGVRVCFILVSAASTCFN